MDRAQEGRRFFLGRLTPGNWLAPAVLGCMTLTLLALFVFPVRRIFADVEVTYNEGWNAYKQAMAAHAIPLYGAPRAQFTGSTGYPPLSFHLIGWLGRMGSFTAAGRWVSLISLIVAGVFVALIVRRESGSPWASLFSFLLYEIGVVILLPNRVGMNDPQLLGEALSACGLYFYLRSSGSNRLLYISAFAFCLAGFTKQNLIAFPIAVGLDLLLRSRKEFATNAGIDYDALKAAWRGGRLSPDLQNQIAEAAGFNVSDSTWIDNDISLTVRSASNGRSCARRDTPDNFRDMLRRRHGLLENVQIVADHPKLLDSNLLIFSVAGSGRRPVSTRRSSRSPSRRKSSG